MKKKHDGSWTAEATVSLEPHMTVPWLIDHRAQVRPESVCIERKSRFGSLWQPVTISEFDKSIRRVSRGLLGLGIEPGETMAIFGATSYEWSLLDMAALSVGIVVVPIYESDSAEQIQWILEDSAIRVVFTDTAAHAELVESVRTPDRKSVV